MTVAGNGISEHVYVHVHSGMLSKYEHACSRNVVYSQQYVCNSKSEKNVFTFVYSQQFLTNLHQSLYVTDNSSQINESI